MILPVIDINQLSFAYPDGRQAIKAIDLTIEAGERVALVGPNGAGKSTLLLHLNGILHGTGTVSICGIQLNDKNKKKIRELVGIVFQDPDDQLFSLSVLEDVAFGPLQQGLTPEQAKQRAYTALDSVGMAKHAHLGPHQLSLGERKRVAIATVLAMQPQVLVLDEPTAGLDPRAQRSLIALLEEMPQTLIIATHDMRLVWQLCPRTVIMDGGQIVADGATSDLLADEALMEAHGLEIPWPKSVYDGLYNRDFLQPRS